MSDEHEAAPMYRYDKDDVRRASLVAMTTDINEALSKTLNVHPLLDKTSGVIGDALAAEVVLAATSVLHTLVLAVAAADDEGVAVDVTPGLTTIGQHAEQATAAAFLRGVLIGHELAQPTKGTTDVESNS